MLSPALGGIVIGQEVGACARRPRAVRRAAGRACSTLRRGFTLSAADRVLVVEDVITTGGSTRETAESPEAGAQVVGAAAIVDRGSDPTRLNLPL